MTLHESGREDTRPNDKSKVPDWTGAHCTAVDPELFFGNARNLYKQGQVERAREVCSGCPVATACLQYALDNKVQGIWAGTTDEERGRLRQGRVVNAVSNEHYALMSDGVPPLLVNWTRGLGKLTPSARWDESERMVFNGHRDVA